MGTKNTESMHKRSKGLDLLEPQDILGAMLEGQSQAAGSVGDALPQISAASELMAHSLNSGGRLIYAAAGSSGLMAMADALELPGTFGIDRKKIVVLFAGGAPTIDTFVGGPEDNEKRGEADAGNADLTQKDCVIVVSASGTTPYALGALRHAVGNGTPTISLANNADTPLLSESDVAICLSTPPELVAGSTRLGAGTAQKIALNMMSTLMAIHLGHVVDGYMVNLVADNRKLQGRAAGIVSALAGTDSDSAQTFLDQANGSVKLAILPCKWRQRPCHCPVTTRHPPTESAVSLGRIGSG